MRPRVSVQQVLAMVRANDSAGNPEGHTEMHTYHVWEVLNALQDIDVLTMVPDEAVGATRHDTSAKVPGRAYQPCSIDERGYCTVLAHYWVSGPPKQGDGSHPWRDVP